MLPLTLLNAAQDLVVTVECKAGQMYKGTLQSCDLFMNVMLKDVTELTQKESDSEPLKLEEIYIRGISIKCVKIPDGLLDEIVNERALKKQEFHATNPTPQKREPKRVR